MKAAVFEEVGKPIRVYDDVDTIAPRAGEARVKAHFCSVVQIRKSAIECGGQLRRGDAVTSAILAIQKGFGTNRNPPIFLALFGSPSWTHIELFVLRHRPKSGRFSRAPGHNPSATQCGTHRPSWRGLATAPRSCR